MKNLFLSIIVLTLSISAWAQETQTVNYIDANGEKTVTATVVTNETGTLITGWYVVTGDVSKGNITCNGDVHLILADGAKLTARGGDYQAGITVSGDGNSLTIYGQTAQSGQLIANGAFLGAGIGGGNGGSGSNITINGGVVTANGGENAAGIGGGYKGSGSNIIINGGMVTANGTENGAGIGGGYQGSGSNITINGGTVTANGSKGAASIGGGYEGSGSNIIINGGVVTANGGENAAGIGGGYKGSGSNIKVSADCQVFADNSTPPTIEIQHGSDEDIASKLNKRHAIIKIDQNILSTLRSEAISVIDEAIAGVADVNIIAIAQRAKNDIKSAENRAAITAIKDAALAELERVINYYNSGKTDAFGELGIEKAGTAVKVTKGDKEVILYAPDKVEYIIRK